MTEEQLQRRSEIKTEIKAYREIIEKVENDLGLLLPILSHPIAKDEWLNMETTWRNEAIRIIATYYKSRIEMLEKEFNEL